MGGAEYLMPVCGAEGKPLYLVTCVQDITERKQAEAENKI